MSFKPVVFLLIVLPFLIWESMYHKFFPIPALEVQYEDKTSQKPKNIIEIRASGSNEAICSESINHKELPNLSDFSPYLTQAVIASEDNRYDWHVGIDPIALARIGINFIQTGSVEQGGSTITQQVARTVYFNEVGNERSIKRKLDEMFYALRLEFFLNKDQILKLYLNRVFTGRDNYGFEAASQDYFGKSAAFLNIQEAAALVSILPAPNFYPLTENANQGSVDRAIYRRNKIIQRMAELGFISDDDKEKALKAQATLFRSQRFSESLAPHFCSYIIEQELPSILGSLQMLEGGFIVESTLDYGNQNLARIALEDSISIDGAIYGFKQGSILTLDLKTGEILAMVGGVGDGINRSISFRQPGSTFKPFIYTKALEENVSLSRKLSCDAFEWKEQVYKACERSGDEATLSLYDGLVWSENVITLRLAQELGLKSAVDSACKLGIRFEEPNYCQVEEEELQPGLVLGQKEVRLLDMTAAYATFGNNGILNQPHGIRKIVDRQDCVDPTNPETCRILYQSTADSNLSKAVLSSNVSSQINRVLQSAIQNGTGKGAFLGEGEAGKTGTTNDSVDLWFIGYDPSNQMATGVWLGNDDNTGTEGSSEQAAKLWGNYMRNVNESRQ